MPSRSFMAPGTIQVSATSPIYCFQKATQTQTVGYANITTILAGADATHQNILPFKCIPGAGVLALWHVWTGDITAGPTIRVYTKMPRSQAPIGPEDEILEMLANNTSTVDNRQFWMPLSDIKTGVTSHVLGSDTPSMNTTNTGKGDQQVSAPLLLDVLGREEILVVVETALVKDGSGADPTGKVMGCMIW